MGWPFSYIWRCLYLKSEFHAYIQNEIEPFEDVDIDLSNGINKIHARVTGKSNSLPLRSEGIGKPKPVASFDEMISSLEKRIKIREKDKCRLQILIRENSYYRISYFAKLLFTEKPSIRPSFDNFYALIKLDSYIRTSVSRLTPTIEMFAKSTLAHVLLTIKKDSDVYLDKTIYKYNSTSDKKKLNRSLSVCATSIQREKSHNESIKHYVSFHSGHIPIWAFFDVLTFGEFNMLSTRLEKTCLGEWFKYIVDNRPMTKSLLYIDAHAKSLPSFFQTVQLLRNASAHNSRIYGKRFVYNPSIKLENSYWTFYERKSFQLSITEVSKQIHSLFTGLMIMRFFFACMSEKKIEKWNKFVYKLKCHISKTKFVNLGGYLGFPDNCFTLLNIETKN